MSIASEPKKCPKCGAPIPTDAPQGLCPKCLLLEISVSTDAGQSAKSKPAPPSREELVAAFPQLEILELIGQGGMGFVFKARQPKLDRFVALKILPQSLAADPAFAERFSREGRLLARLNHPNIVTVHDFGVASGRRPEDPKLFYLLMEYVDGVNLRQAMRAGRFTPDQALAVVPKICEALQFAHNEGILHRDIKPENILLDTKGRVKIADFGIAKLIEMERGSVSRSNVEEPKASGQTEVSITNQPVAGHRPAIREITAAGKILGTPNYMAPEQIEKSGEVDHRADIYSLGVVFYEMLTGELPLGRFAPPSQKSSADPRLDDVVLRALEKEPNRRTQSAGEVKTQVETVAANQPSQPNGETGSTPKWIKHLLRGAISGLIVIFLSVFLSNLEVFFPSQKPVSLSELDVDNSDFFQLKIVRVELIRGILLGIVTAALITFISRKRSSRPAVGVSLPSPPPPDRFWKRFAIAVVLVLLALILIPVLLYFALFAFHEARPTHQEKPNPAIVIDNDEAISQGEWGVGTARLDAFKNSYFYCAAASGMPQASTTYRPHIKVPGKYDVEIWYPQATNHTTHAWWIVSCADGESRVLVDQTTNGGQWIKIADNQFFSAGTNGFVRLVNKTPGFDDSSRNNFAVADAVRLVPPDPTKKLMVSENFTAGYILAMTLEKYKSLSSFRADAVKVTEMKYDDDPKLHVITGQSSILMARPHYTRFTSGESNSTNAIKDVAWSNDDGAFETTYSGVAKLDKRKDTPASELFFGVPNNWLSRLTKLSLEPATRIDEDDCFVISGESYGPTKFMVWVRKKDFLVKQTREDSEGHVAASPLPSANSVGSMELRTIPTRTLRLYPQPLPPSAASPPAIAASPQPEPDARPSRTFSIRRTQTFGKIVANEPPRREDFSHASMPLLSDRNDPKARRNLGQALMLSGKNEQALEEFLWCWDHGKKDKDFSSTRVVYLLSDISQLGTQYPPALDALRKRRDEIEKKLIDGKEGSGEIYDLSRLNTHLKDSGRTLELFDRMPANSPVRKEMFGHILSQLIETKRYEDVLSFLDPEDALGNGMEMRRRELEFRKRYSMASPADEYMRKRTLESWSQYFEALAGAKQTERAKKMADTILEFDSASDTRALLEKAARHADNQDLVIYLHPQ